MEKFIHVDIYGRINKGMKRRTLRKISSMFKRLNIQIVEVSLDEILSCQNGKNKGFVTEKRLERVVVVM